MYYITEPPRPSRPHKSKPHSPPPESAEAASMNRLNMDKSNISKSSQTLASISASRSVASPVPNSNRIIQNGSFNDRHPATFAIMLYCVMAFANKMYCHPPPLLLLGVCIDTKLPFLSIYHHPSNVAVWNFLPLKSAFRSPLSPWLDFSFRSLRFTRCWRCMARTRYFLLWAGGRFTAQNIIRCTFMR